MPRRLLQQQPLKRREPIHAAHAQVAGQGQGRVARTEEQPEAVHQRQHSGIVGPPPPGVAAQPALVAQPHPAAPRRQQLLRQHRRIHQPQIHPLARQGVNAVGGISHQRQPRQHVALGVALHQREGDGALHHRHLAQAMVDGRGQLAPQGLGREPLQPFGLLRRGGPDDGAVVALPLQAERQEGERPGGQEGLTGHLAVGTLHPDRGHQGHMPGVTLSGPDPGQFAQRRTGTVGRHHQGGHQAAPVVQAYPARLPLGGLQAGHPASQHQAHRGQCRQAALQGRQGHVVLDDMAQGRHPGLVRREAHLAAALGIPHLHEAVGADATGRHPLPGAQPLQQATGDRRQGADPHGGQATPHRFGVQQCLPGIHQGHLDPRLAQQAGQGGAHHARTDDRHLGMHLTTPFGACAHRERLLCCTHAFSSSVPGPWRDAPAHVAAGRPG